MLALKQDSQVIKDTIIVTDLKVCANILSRSWLAKKLFAGAVTNAGLDAVYEIAVGADAVASKISGVGGGEFRHYQCRV